MPNVLYSGIPQDNIQHVLAFVARPNAVHPMVSRGEVASKSHQRRLHLSRHCHRIGVETIDCIGRHQRHLIELDTLVALNFNDKISRIQAVEFPLRNLKLEGIFRPGCICSVDFLRSEHFTLISEPQGDDDMCGAAQMPRIKTAGVARKCDGWAGRLFA